MIGLLVVSVIGFYHRRSRNHELKSGVPFKCFIYLQSYSKFRSKVVCFCLIIYYFVMVLALLCNVYFVYLTCYCVDDLGG